MLLSEFIVNETSDDKKRLVFKINNKLAPVKCTILPLVKKEEFLNVSKQIYNNLRLKFICNYDESGCSIGKRYVRSDIIGVPKCITVDSETLENNTVTIRDRDTMNQIRVKISELENYLQY